MKAFSQHKTYYTNSVVLYTNFDFEDNSSKVWVESFAKRVTFGQK